METLCHFFGFRHMRTLKGTNRQARALAEQGRLRHPYSEFQRGCGLQGRDLWLLLGLEEIQSGSESPRSSEPDPDTDTGSDPGTPMVSDLLGPTSDPSSKCAGAGPHYG